MKREEARIAAEMEEREQEEARKLLEAAQKKMGAKRLHIAEGAHLDKQQLMTQVQLLHKGTIGCFLTVQAPW